MTPIRRHEPRALSVPPFSVQTPPKQSASGTVLIVDDDQGTLQTFEAALRQSRFQVRTARSGAEGIRAAIANEFDVVILDMNLGDMSGLDFVQSTPDVLHSRVVIVSGFLSIPAAVRMMKLGVADVLEKPVDVDELIAAVGAVQRRTQAGTGERETGIAARWIMQPRSAAERWASYVIKGRISDTDVKTLDCWARVAGVSCTTLCATCRLMGTRPLEARDFARVLRAVRIARVHHAPPEVFLDVADGRTIRALSLRAGIDLETEPKQVSLQQLLTNQRFVRGDNEGVRLVQLALQEDDTLGAE